MDFSPDDIEHGILRGNSRPPNSLFRPFGEGDGRLRYAITPVEPRIHFALVCASSSCPPVEVYTPEKLGDELDISGRTFINSGAVEIDKEEGKVLLSRVFKWYGGDFAPDQAGLLRFIAPFLYREEDTEYLEKNAERLKVGFLDYDWRLNRSD